jgi:hypothetical protein
MKNLILTIAILLSVLSYGQNQKVVGYTKDGVFYDASNGAVTAEVNYLAPLDSVVTASDSVQIISNRNDLFYQEGVNAQRRKVLRVDEPGLEWSFKSDVPIGSVARFRTGSANDSLDLIPLNGYTIIGDGQSGENAVRIKGVYNLLYVEKVASDTLLASSANPTWFDYSACSPDANEQAVTANATSDPNCNEADAFTGFSNNGLSTLESSSVDPQTGLYHLRMVSADGNFDRAEYTFSVTSGDTFTITYWAKEAVGTNGGFASPLLLSGSTTDNWTSTWTQYTQNVTATGTGTATIRFYAAFGTGVTGDTAYVDNLSIVKTN